jgi:hypothetical protein
MAEDLSLDSIKEMKKAEYIKAFKNKAAWKKAKAAIFLVDYKLEGKKAVIAIPFKKENEMKLEMKRLKKEKLHLLKKSGGGTILFGKNASGEREAKIEINIGGLKPELLILKGSPLFDKIKVKIQAIQVGEAINDAAASAGEVDPNENLPEDKFEDVAIDESTDDFVSESADDEMAKAAPNPKKEKLLNALKTLKENADKLKAAFGKITLDKVQANADKLKTALDKILSEAKEFVNEVGDEAQELIKEVRNIVKEALNPEENSNNAAAIDKNKLQHYADQGRLIAEEFKALQATIKKNLADLLSEKEDVDLVKKMVEKVQKHNTIFESMLKEEKEKVQKMNDTISAKIRPELDKMMKDVLRYLKVRDEIMVNFERGKEAAIKGIDDMKARIEKIKADLKNLSN